MYFEKGFAMANTSTSASALQYYYESIGALDTIEGNYKNAYNDYKNYIQYRDSAEKQFNTKMTVQIQMQYDFDKKEAATKGEQEKKDAVALKELQKRKLVRNGFVGGFAVVLLFAGIFFT